ncbi:MAG: hypothetical protein Kow00107_05430 [Planctomycetota bacterium]
MNSNGCSNIRSEEYANGLPECHQAGLREPNEKERRRPTALQADSDNGTADQCAETVLGERAEDIAQGAAREVLQGGAKVLHTIQKEGYAGDDGENCGC